MTTRWTAIILAGVTLAGAPAATGAQAAPAGRELVYDVPIDARAPDRATLLRGSDGKLYLSYYLTLTNWARSELIFERLDILDAERGRVVASYDTLALRRSALLQVAVPDPPKRESQRHLPSGRIALLRTWLSFESESQVPVTLVHRFTFAPNPALRIAPAQADTDAAPVITTGIIAVDPRPAVVIDPPLRGGPWRASGGAGPFSHHLGAAVLDGRARLPEHFAVDFQKVDSAGSILPNPFPSNLTNAMFYSNRADVLAVADGEVVFLRDGIPENVPTPSGDENMPVPLTRESTAGNQIGIRIAPGVYAQYAHLMPGSIRVKLGDRVRRGQVIGNVGNAGNSKNPHLHFEIADGPEINAAEGLPWVMSRFWLWGHQTQAGMPDVRQEPVEHRMEMLLQDAIVRFP
jgi:hypothetical protein